MAVLDWKWKWTASLFFNYFFKNQELCYFGVDHLLKELILNHVDTPALK